MAPSRSPRGLATTHTQLDRPPRPRVPHEVALSAAESPSLSLPLSSRSTLTTLGSVESAPSARCHLDQADHDSHRSADGTVLPACTQQLEVCMTLWVRQTSCDHLAEYSSSMAFAIPCLSHRPSRLRFAIRRLLADCSSLLAKTPVHLNVLCHLRGGGMRPLPYLYLGMRQAWGTRYSSYPMTSRP